MIRINLTPFEELENPLWWLPDAIVLAAVILLTFGGAYLYVGSIEADIAMREGEKQRFISETAALQGDVAKFNELNTMIGTLDNRKGSLQRITNSKLVRFLPVILLENIQNLKPNRVWLDGLAFIDKKKPEGDGAVEPPPPPPASNPPPAGEGEGDKAAPSKAVKVEAAVTPTPAAEDYPVTIEIQGEAYDNIAIADFMLSLKATQNQTFDKGDLRSQLFFSDVGIIFSEIQTNATPSDLSEAKASTVKFKLALTFREKAAPASEEKFTRFIDQFKQTGQARMY